jgi:arabinose-5-phosphate isomerase
MLKQIFARERQFLNYFFDNVNFEQAETVLAHILKCKGMIIFSGVGKSGIIAEKLSKTMISTGSKSLFLSAQEALHGDIGITTKQDLVILLSKSGKSVEIINLAKLCKKRGVSSIAWISDKGSELEKHVDFSMHLPLEGEICPFGLAPTTSTALQLIFGDCLAVALMESSKFSIDQYALNHPAGSIGKLISESVGDVMASGDDIPFCTTATFIKDALFTLSQKKLGVLLINDDEENLVGVFTDGDLRRLIEKEGSLGLDKTMKEVMHTNFISISKNYLTSKALEIMENKNKPVLVLPVVDGTKAIGVIHMHHIISSNISPLYN